MVDFVLELIDFNEGVDYSIVSKIIVGYLVLLWVFVSIWVYNDAKNRFDKVWLAMILGVLNLILSFPFLLIYLLIRPSHKEDWDDFGDIDGGINIPVVNFSGDDGVVISLQLKINSDKLSTKNTEYKLDISLNSDEEDDEPSIFPSMEKAQGLKEESSESRLSKLKAKFKKIPEKMSRRKEKFTNNIKKVTLTEESMLEELDAVVPDKPRKQKKSKKNKNKKRR